MEAGQIRHFLSFGIPADKMNDVSLSSSWGFREAAGGLLELPQGATGLDASHAPGLYGIETCPSGLGVYLVPHNQCEPR